MQAVRLQSVADFLDASARVRAEHPVLTNVLATVAAGAQSRPDTSDVLCWLVLDSDDTVVGCGVRTHPWPLVVSPMPPAAAQALGAAVAATDDRLPGVSGPAQVVHDVVAGLGARWRAAPGMTDTVYVLDRLVAPPAAAGARRAPQSVERDLLLRWLVDFHAEVGLPARDPADSFDARTADGAMWVWDVGGAPAALVGHAPAVAGPGGTFARIGPVYTPPAHRRHGYARALTAAVAAELADGGATVTLYADADYEPSNRLYRGLGFVAGATVQEVTVTRERGDVG